MSFLDTREPSEEKNQNIYEQPFRTINRGVRSRHNGRADRHVERAILRAVDVQAESHPKPPKLYNLIAGALLKEYSRAVRNGAITSF